MSQGVGKSEITYVDCIKSLILHKNIITSKCASKLGLSRVGVISGRGRVIPRGRVGVGGG